MKIRIVIGRIFLVLLLLCVGFVFWMSPRLGGLIPLGKEHISKDVYRLTFDSVQANQYNLMYVNESNRENLVKLRQEYRLDSLVQDCKSDFEKIMKIQSWVQSRWVHNGDNVPANHDALYILKEAEKGARFRCVEYATVSQQCLASLGFVVRGLGLMTKDIAEVKYGGGHVVNEVYLKDLRKWVFIDPQYDVITQYDGIPLNAVELQQCIANHQDFELINPNNIISKEDYTYWIGPYLYYFTVSLHKQPIRVWDRIIGSKKQLTLYSLDAVKPVYFQKMMRLNTAYYTHSLKDFYPVL